MELTKESIEVFNSLTRDINTLTDLINGFTNRGCGTSGTIYTTHLVDLTPCDKYHKKIIQALEDLQTHLIEQRESMVVVNKKGDDKL